MARPQKQGMDYFPHDTDASNDEKIEILRALYGNDGYAFYFILLERIYRTANFELDVSDAETIQILARKVDVTIERFSEMLASALKRRCFCPTCYADRKVLTSPGIQKRAQGVVSKRQKMASSYQQKQTQPAIPANQGVSDAETTPETQQKEGFPSREKESKGKERKEEYSSSTTTSSPAREEIENEPLKAEVVPAAETKSSGDSYFHFSNKICAEQQFIESTCMSLKVSRAELLLQIDQFTHEQRALAKQYPDYNEYKTHCYRWLNVAINKPSQSNGSNRSTPPLPGRTGSGPVNRFGQGADLSGKQYKQESFK